PQRVVFSYGFNSGKPIPPGSSRVTITLAPDADGTRLKLMHELTDESVRDEHVQGWRFQLSLFANIVSDEVNAAAASAVDTWLAAWAIADVKERERALAGIAEPGVRFRDRFSHLDGVSDILPHITASQHFMPGMRLVRKGNVRHCQGTALADWTAVGP